MPLFDQDENETDELVCPVSAILSKIVVRHDEVRLLSVSGEDVIIVARPTHPGAGLLVEISDNIKL